MPRKKLRGKGTDTGYRNQQTQLPLRGQYWLIPVSRLMLRSYQTAFFRLEISGHQKAEGMVGQIVVGRKKKGAKMRLLLPLYSSQKAN